MAAAAAADDGDALLVPAVALIVIIVIARTEVDDLVLGIQGNRGVGERHGAERGVDEVRWVIDEVLGRHFFGLQCGVLKHEVMENVSQSRTSPLKDIPECTSWSLLWVSWENIDSSMRSVMRGSLELPQAAGKLFLPLCSIGLCKQ